MKNDNTFSKFYTKLSDIINSCFNLGERINGSKVIKKILKYLLKRFRPRVSIRKESKNVDLVRVYELIRSLQTYEMALPSTMLKGKS